MPPKVSEVDELKKPKKTPKVKTVVDADAPDIKVKKVKAKPKVESDAHTPKVKKTTATKDAAKKTVPKVTKNAKTVAPKAALTQQTVKVVAKPEAKVEIESGSDSESEVAEGIERRNRLREYMSQQYENLLEEVKNSKIFPPIEIDDNRPLVRPTTAEQIAPLYKCTDLSEVILTSEGKKTIGEVFEIMIKELPEIGRVNGIGALYKNFRLKNGDKCSVYFGIKYCPLGTMFYKNHTTNQRGEFADLNNIHLRFIAMNRAHDPYAQFILPKRAMEIMEEKSRR